MPRHLPEELISDRITPTDNLFKQWNNPYDGLGSHSMSYSAGDCDNHDQREPQVK